MNKDKPKEKESKSICRAKITPSDNSDYDFECVAVPIENGQVNYNYREDEYFNQVLRTAQENVITDRLESGLPLFDNHPWDNSAENTLGITTSYSFDERGIVVRVKLGARADEALRSDIKNGIIKTVSIEGTIVNYSVERENNKLPVYYAELWEPESLSFAPVPQDIGSQIAIKRNLERSNSLENKTEKSIINNLKSKF